MSHPAWALIVIGVLIALAGIVWLWAPSSGWLGRLPGDIVIERDHFKLYFPLATCIVLSLILSAVLWLVRYFG